MLSYSGTFGPRGPRAGNTPMKKASQPPAIESFRLQPGKVLAGKYEVTGFFGVGWEGEVYKLREIETGIDVAGKFFFPHRNIGGKARRIYARKLHKLRSCPILIQYHTSDTCRVQDRK